MATKKKLSIADLQTKPKRLQLKHPEIDLVDSWVDIIPTQQSLEYMLTVMKIRNMDVDNLSPLEQFELQADLVVSVIQDWSEDSFGFAFEKAAAKTFFMSPTNTWIRSQIEEALKEESDFFTNA